MTTQAEALYEFYRAHPKYKDVAATENMLLTNCQRPVTVETLEATAARLGDRLAVSGDYTRAYRDFFQSHPEIEDCDATRNVLDRAHFGDDITAESLEELFQVPSIRAMLPESTRHQEQRAQQAERQRLIDEITEGRANYGAWSPQYGQMRYYPSTHLADETDERIAEIHALVTEQRRSTGMTSAEKRKVLQAGQYQLPELPETWTIPSTGETINLTRSEMLRKMKNKEDWRQLLNQFGNKAVDARLKGLN